MRQLKKHTPFTFLILELNSLIDSGKYNDISIEEVYNWIDRKEILTSLYERTGCEIDLSFFRKDGPHPDFFDLYHDQMYALSGGYTGAHRKKWGVENLGLCLLLAWTNELIQQGSEWKPNEDYAR